jgi:hypothetical protein
VSSPYQALVGPTGRFQRFTPEVAKERKAEQMRRNTRARDRAYFVLSKRHNAEFEELFAAEKAAIAEDRGPLPGDEDT